MGTNKDVRELRDRQLVAAFSELNKTVTFIQELMQRAGLTEKATIGDLISFYDEKKKELKPAE